MPQTLCLLGSRRLPGALHNKPGEPGLFQAVQHRLGVGADGEGPHLDPVQGIALGRLGGLGASCLAGT